MDRNPDHQPVVQSHPLVLPIFGPQGRYRRRMALVARLQQRSRATQMNPPEPSPILLILIRHDRDLGPVQDVADPAKLAIPDRLRLLVESGHDLRPSLPRHEGEAERMERDIPARAACGREMSDPAPCDECEFGFGGAAGHWRFLQGSGGFQTFWN